MNSFICPVCGEPLILKDRTFRCDQRHSFDQAKQGYVNLVRSQKKSHGDDAAMVQARSRFLNSGAYQPLKETLTELICSLHPQTLLDAGCGEGYYTSLTASLPNCQSFGIDLSKEALKAACRACPQVQFAAASLFELPFADASFDLILSCFAPLALDENVRVLKPGGTLIVVGPGEQHLMGLKKVLYEQPYPNPTEPLIHPCFELIDQKILSYSFTLNSQSLIQDLFTMTPYYYKTSLSDSEKLLPLTSLHSEAEFRISVYRVI